MKAREYCCCAIPIVNAGIYAALLEQFALGIVAGTLSVATSSSMSRQTEADPFLGLVIETHPFRSRWCCDTRRCQMDPRYTLLHWGRHPSIGFHRCIEGEQIAHPYVFRSMRRSV